jgi:hypothetical protein
MLVGTNFGSHIEKKWPLASTTKGEVSTPTPNEYHFITKKEIKERSALTNLVDESYVDIGCAWRRLVDGG